MTPAVYAFTVPGVPKGKQRPRFARVGRFAKAYTPKETVNYESLIRHTFAEKYPGHVPLAGPVTVSVRAYHPIPASTPKKKMADMQAETVPYAHKSDADNILKVFGDALNEIAWKDDCLITDATVSKRYSPRPRVEVEIMEGK
jgi:Holliday junction resolvase RusA-like endonuclease